MLFCPPAAEQALSGVRRSRGRPGPLQAPRVLSHGRAGVREGGPGLSLHHREDVREFAPVGSRITVFCWQACWGLLPGRYSTRQSDRIYARDGLAGWRTRL